MFWSFIESQLKSNEKACVSDVSEELKYSDLIVRMDHICAMLFPHIPPRSKCGILCERSMNTLIALLSCWKLDLVPIILSKNYGEDHCNKILELTCPDLLFTDSKDMTAIKHSAIPVFFLAANEEDIYFRPNKHVAGLHDVPDDVAIIMCTSGTTGFPKGAMITEAGLKTNILDISRYFKIGKPDKILIARPLYHCAVLTGELLISLHHGLDIYFLDEIYNPISIINCIERENITVMCGTPTLFHHICMILKRRIIYLNLKSIVISGECLAEEVARTIRDSFKNTLIYNVYGLTEASPRVSYLSPDLYDRYPGSVGVPLRSVKVKIVDENQNELPPCMDGELILSAPNVMKGYYHNEALTAEVIRDGWLHTGDIACMDEEGRIFIRSRSDDMIIKAGMNLYPVEIETALKKNAQVEDVAAYGIQAKMGCNIGIDIVLTDEYKDYSISDVMALCIKSLPVYQLPDKIRIVNALEENASGKMVRFRKHEI